MPRSSRIAHAFWPRWYRALGALDGAIERIWRRTGLGNVVRVTVTGRRTGQPRSLFLGLLRVGPRRYLGHPDLACAWTLNLEASGAGELETHDGRRVPFKATLLGPGTERDAVIRATFHQHPFPGNVCYWLLRQHLRAAGRFYRLSSIEDRSSVPTHDAIVVHEPAGAPHGPAGASRGPDTAPHAGAPRGPDTAPHAGAPRGPDTAPHAGAPRGPDTAPHAGANPLS